MPKNIFYHGISKNILSTRLSSIESQPKKKVVVVVAVVVVVFVVGQNRRQVDRQTERLTDS